MCNVNAALILKSLNFLVCFTQNIQNKSTVKTILMKIEENQYSENVKESYSPLVDINKIKHGHSSI